jgi:hypothetical protein
VTTVSTIDNSQKRRLALEASVDPRTIAKVLAGEPVRGLAGDRARSVLKELGYPVPEPRQVAKELKP